MEKRGTLVVTGAASGIGLSVIASRELAETFDRVIAVDLAPPPADWKVVAAPQVVWVRLDVREADAVDAMLAEHDDGAAPYIGLVNSAGNHHAGDSLSMSPEDFRSVIDVHLIGTFLVSRGIARQMHDGGSIVNLSSVGGRFGLAGRAAYSAAKAGIEGLTRALAVEWAPRGLRVNAVAPGYIDTPMGMKGVTNRRATESLHALNRFGFPNEVCSAILFLLSDLSSFVTGSVLVVDGGYSVYKGTS